MEFRVYDIRKEVELLKAKGVNFYVRRQVPNLMRVPSDEIMEFPWGKAALFKDSEGNELSLVEDQ